MTYRFFPLLFAALFLPHAAFWLLYDANETGKAANQSWYAAEGERAKLRMDSLPALGIKAAGAFPDSASHKLARERYRSEIMPEHKKQLVDGLDFPALGKIVAERTTSPVGGHVEAMRLGM